MGKDINEKPFDDGTKLKLEIFQTCFKEWFPVLVHNHETREIFIADLLAGSGTDPDGLPGSPLLIIEEICRQKERCCKQLVTYNKIVNVYLNEIDEQKTEQLRHNVQQHLVSCKDKCGYTNCPIHVHYRSKDVDKIMRNNRFRNYMSDPLRAKFIILDQYGFKHVDEEVFKSLILYPKTDFIFFIASSFVRRFAKSEVVKKYFHSHKINFDEKRPKECHRIIVDYYKTLIPSDKDYFIHGFTIKKESNYWGLVFGTSHMYGMEKFLNTCWNIDKDSGESNCNINDDFPEDSLLRWNIESNKINQIKEDIEKGILNREIKNSVEGLSLTLHLGGLPRFFQETVKKLSEEGKIQIDPPSAKLSKGKVHRMEKYSIIVK